MLLCRNGEKQWLSLTLQQKKGTIKVTYGKVEFKMKKTTKLLACFLTLLCVCLPCVLGVSAAGENKTISMLCYNVAGLPSIDDLLNKPDAQHLTDAARTAAERERLRRDRGAGGLQLSPLS